LLPNNAHELLLSYLLSAIKKPSFLAQNLSFCQIDIWDTAMLIHCPGQEVFEFLLEHKKALATVISKQLSEIDMVHIHWQKRVADLTINYMLTGENNLFDKFQLASSVAKLVKQSLKPVLVVKLDGQILFAYAPQNQNFPIKNIYLRETETKHLAAAVASHGWVSGYRLRLNGYEEPQGVVITVRARYTQNTLLNQLVLLTQVLNTQSGDAPSKDIVYNEEQGGTPYL